MSLRFVLRKKDPNPSGKFLAQRRGGLEHQSGQSYRDWTYQLVYHRSGTTVARTVYNVTVRNQSGVRSSYLQGYSSASQAGDAARLWIDNEIRRALSPWCVS